MTHVSVPFLSVIPKLNGAQQEIGKLSPEWSYLLELVASYYPHLFGTIRTLLVASPASFWLILLKLLCPKTLISLLIPTAYSQRQKLVNIYKNKSLPSNLDAYFTVDVTSMKGFLWIMFLKNAC